MSPNASFRRRPEFGKTNTLDTGLRRCGDLVSASLSLALGTFLLATPGAVSAGSLCLTNEKIVFACPVGTKLVSLCAAPIPGSEAASLQYRFGRPGRKPELVYPAAGAKADFRAGGTILAGGGGAWIEFARSSYRYVVYSFWIQGKGEVAGVAVDKGGQRQATLRCKGAAISELGPDYFTTAGIAPSNEEFIP